MTDAGLLTAFNDPGAGLHDEVALYVENGLPLRKPRRQRPDRAQRGSAT